MKPNSVYIDHFNSEQVHWWNNVGSKLVKVVSYCEVKETATNKRVGTIFMVKGLLADFVIKKCNSFFKEATSTMVFDR